MIVKDEMLNNLRRYFLLNLYEVKIWAALLSRGVSTAGELSDIANVPRSRSYDVLESLEKKGFIIHKVGKPIKYIAIPPKEVVERVKKNLKEDTDKKIDRLSNLKGSEMLNELNVLHTQGVELIEPNDLSGSLRGRHNLYDHLELITKNAQNSVTLMTSSEGFMRKMEALKPTFEKLKKKGVKIRIAAPMTNETQNVAKEIEKFAEIRHTKDVNARFCIVDGKEITFMILDDKEVHPTYDSGIWVNSPYFAKAMESMFDVAWKDMPSAGKKG